MSFYSERIVKKPKKRYQCEVCLKPITGQHIYIAGMNNDGDFTTTRMHEDCQKEQFAACLECAESSDMCCMPYWECYQERMKEKEQEK